MLQDLLDDETESGASRTAPSAAFIGQIVPVMLMRVPEDELDAQLELLALHSGEPLLFALLCPCSVMPLADQLELHTACGSTPIAASGFLS